MNYGYARTSTFDQQYGLDDQIAQLNKAGCDRIYSEQVSATGHIRRIARGVANTPTGTRGIHPPYTAKKTRWRPPLH